MKAVLEKAESLMKFGKELYDETLVAIGYEVGATYANTHPHTQGDAGFIPALADPATTTLEKIKEQLLKGDSSSILCIDFTEKEMQILPRYFKKKFKTNGVTAFVRLKDNGVYEIRCRQYGLNVAASSKILEEAKAKFSKRLVEQIIDKYKYAHTEKIENERKKKLSAKRLHMEQKIKKISTPPPEPEPELIIEPAKPELDFCETFDDWFYNFKLPMVKKETATGYRSRYNAHIKPYFKKFKLKEVLPKHCQEVLNKLMLEGKTRVWEDIYTLLNQFFNFAFDNDFIEKNPMARIKFIRSERVNGTALTLQEERRLLDHILSTKYAPDLILMLYGGLRPCEVESAEIGENFITCLNRKQKKNSKVVKTKRIPITPMLKRYLYLFKGKWFVSLSALKTAMQPFFRESPNHMYDLRHTFSTRAQECGVPQEIVSHWLGHTARTLNGQVYTHYSDEFLLAQAAKIEYEIPPKSP